MSNKNLKIEPFEITDMNLVVLVSVMVTDQDSMKDILDQIGQHSTHKVLMWGYVPKDTDVHNVDWAGKLVGL